MTTKKLKDRFVLKMEVSSQEVAMLNFAINCAARFFRANPDSTSEHMADFVAFGKLADRISEWIHINNLCKDPRCDSNGKHIDRTEDAN